MVFSSPVFLFIFLPVVYLLHLITPTKARNFLLLLASLLFYGWGEPVFVLLMIVSSIVNYFLARGLGSSGSGESSHKAQARRILLGLTILFNIGLLVVFKYTDFLISAMNNASGSAIPLTGIPLPIGISFFTFQAMSYVIDVYRGHTPVQRRLDHLMLYIAFFPQLIAGPIVKYHDIADQITNRKLTAPDTAAGIRRFITGLAKKLLIANAAGQIADQAFAMEGSELGIVAAWLGAIAYTLQIYFDFSGYSDMAIGLGRVFGFKFKENFNYPFAAVSMQDFWRRWHISLSTWFKEYLYIPLGGNRQGKWRSGINRGIVFFATGLWHGAAWTFVVWGLLHGFFLLLESYGIIKPEKMWRPLRHIYTSLVVILTFVLFRAESFGQAVAYIVSMFRPSLSALTAPAAQILVMERTGPFGLILILSAILMSLPIGKRIRTRAASNLSASTYEAGSYLVAIVLFLLCVLALSAAVYNPFIYFRF